MKKFIAAIIFLLCGFLGSTTFTTQALAEDTGKNYGSLYIGVAMPLAADIKDNGPNPEAWDEMEFDIGPTWGIKAGRWLGRATGNEFIALELDYNGHIVDLDTISLAGTKNGLAGDMTIHAVTGNLILRIPGESIRPYVGVGAGWYYAEIDDSATNGPFGVTFAGDDDYTLGYQALAGLSMSMSDSYSLFLESKYSIADFEFQGGVDLDMEYRAAQVYGGVTFNF